MWLLRGQEAAAPADEQNDGSSLTVEGQTIAELKEQFEQQQQLIQQLKEMLRENEQQVKKKEKELEEGATKLSKLRLQHKAKIADLTNQLKESKSNKSSPEHQSANSEITNESSTAGQNRGKIILLKKKLEENRTMFEKREKEMAESQQNIEKVVTSLQNQLTERDKVIAELNQLQEKENDVKEAKSNSHDGIGFNELYAQIVYKDAKVLELDSKILELERNIMDLQENLNEKDEILSARNQAIHLMSADLSRKGKVVVDQLDDTRDQMKLMQQNFTAVEGEWRSEKSQLIEEVNSLKDQHVQNNNRVKQMEETIAKLETTRFDLSSRNAQLQEKVVHLQEKLEKLQLIENNDYETKCKDLEREVINLKEEVAKKGNSSKEQSGPKSKGSDQKWLKLKAQMTRQIKDLETQIAEMKSNNEGNEKITKLQKRIATLEDEKKQLKHKLIEFEELTVNQGHLKKLVDDLNVKIKQQNDDLDQHVKMVSVLENTKLDLVDQVFKIREESEEQNKKYLEEMQLLKDEESNYQNKISLLENQNTEALEKLNFNNTSVEKENAQIIIEWEMKNKLWLQAEEDLNDQISNLQNNLRNIEESNNKLNTALLEKNETLEKLNEEFSNFKAFFDDKSGEWKAEKNHLNSLIQQLENSGENYEKNMESDSKKLHNLQIELTSTTEINEDLKRQLQVADVEIEKLKASNSEYHTQLTSLQKKQETLEAEITRLEKVVIETEEDFERIITEKDQMVEELKYSLGQTSEEFQSKEESLQNDVAVLREELNITKSEYNSCVHILSEKTDKFQDLMNKMSTLESKTRERDDTLVVTQSRVDELQQAVNQLQSQVLQKEEEIRVFNAKCANLKQQVTVVDGSRLKQDEELCLLQRNLEDMTQQCEDYKNVIKNLQASHNIEVKNLQIQINDLVLKCDELTKNEENLENLIKRLKIEVEELVNSKNYLETQLESNLDKLNDAEVINSELEAAKITIEKMQGDAESHSAFINDRNDQLKVTLHEMEELFKLKSCLEEDLNVVRRTADELKISNETLEQECQNLKLRISITDKEHRDTLSQTEELVKEISNKSLKIDELTVEVHNLQQAVEQLQSERVASENRLQDSLRNNEELSNEILKSSIKIEEFTGEINNSKLMLNQVQGEREVTEKHLQDSFIKVQELVDEKLELTFKIDELMREINNFKLLVNELQGELQILRDDAHLLEKCQDEINSLRIERENLQKLNKSTKDQLDSNENEIKDLELRLKENKSLHEITQLELENVIKSNMKLQEELNNNLISLSDSEKQLDDTLSEKQELLTINSNLQKDLKESEKIVDMLNSTNANLEKSVDELKGFLGVSELLTATEEKLQASEMKNEELYKSNVSLNKRLDDLNVELEITKQNAEQIKLDSINSTHLLESTSNEKEGLVALNSGLKDELDDAREMADKLGADYETLSEKHSEMVKLVDEYTNEIARLDLEVQTRQNKIDESLKNLSELNEKVEELSRINGLVNEEKKAKEIENDNLKRSMERLQFFETEFQRCSENIGILELELSTVKSENEKCNEQNKRLMEYTQQLETDLNNVSENCRIVEEESERLKENLQEVVRESGSLQKQFEDRSNLYESEIENLNLKLVNSSKQLDIIANRETELQETSKSYEDELNEFRLQLESAAEARNGLEIQLVNAETVLNNERKNFEVKVQSLNEQIEILSGNSSNEIQQLTEKLNSAMGEAENRLANMKVEMDSQIEVTLKQKQQLHLVDNIMKKFRDFISRFGYEFSEELEIESIIQIAILHFNKQLTEISTFEANIEDQNKILEKQRHELDEQMQKCSALQNDLEDHKNKLTDLESKSEELEFSKSKICELEIQIQRLSDFENDVEIYRNKITTLEPLAETLESAKSRISELEGEIQKRAPLEKDLEDYKSKLIAAEFIKEEIESSKLKISELNEQLEHSNSHLIRTQNELSDRILLIEQLESRLKEKETSVQLLNDSVEYMRASEVQLTNEMADLRNQLTENERNKVSLLEEINGLKRQIDENKTISVSVLNADELNSELSQYREENSKLSERLIEVEARLKQSFEENQQFNLIIHQISEGMDLANHEFSNQVFSNVVKYIQNICSANVVLREQLVQEDGNLKRLQNEYDSVNTERGMLSEVVEKMKIDLDNEKQLANENNAELEGKIRQLQNEIERHKINQAAKVEQEVKVEQIVKVEQTEKQNSEAKAQVRTESPVVEEHLLGTEPSERANSPQEMKKTMAVLKIKNEKMMTRLKMFKDKNDKLQIQINDLLTERNRLEDDGMRLRDHNQRAKDEIHRLSIDLRNVDRLWKSEVQQLHDRLDTVETANYKLVDIKEDLEKRLMEEVKLRKDLQEEKQRFENTNLQLLSERNSISNEGEDKCQQLERRLNSELEHNKDLEAELRQYQDIIDKLNTEKKNMVIEGHAQAELYRSLNSALEALKDETEKIKLERQELISEHETQIKIHEMEIENIRLRFTSEKEAKESSERRFNEFQVLLTSHYKQMFNSNDDGESFIDILTILQHFIDRLCYLSNENETLKNSQTSNDSQEFLKRLSTFEEQVRNLENENFHLKEETVRGSDEMNRLVSQNAELVQSLQELQIALEKVSLEKETVQRDLNRTIDHLQSEWEAESKRFGDLHIEMENLRASFDNLKYLNETVAAEKEELRSENNSLKEQMPGLANLNTSAIKTVNENSVDDHSYVNLSDYSWNSNFEQVNQLQNELQIAVSSLHTKDLRCEELTDEISELIKERDSLQIRLSTLLRADQHREIHIQMLEREISSRASKEVLQQKSNAEDLASMENPEITQNLHSRLADSETQRNNLQQMNAVLNEALSTEREIRLKLEADLKFSEAELESRYKFNSKTKFNKETKLDLGDSRTALLAENKQIIERTYTGTTWRIMNWIQGRRRYCRRLYRTKHPLQLLWYLYVFVLHVAFLLVAY